MSEQEAVAYIEEWDVIEAAKVLKWYEEDELLRPCDCDTMVAIETEDLKDENIKLRELCGELLRMAESNDPDFLHWPEIHDELRKLGIEVES